MKQIGEWHKNLSFLRVIVLEQFILDPAILAEMINSSKKLQIVEIYARNEDFIKQMKPLKTKPLLKFFLIVNTYAPIVQNQENGQINEKSLAEMTTMEIHLQIQIRKIILINAEQRHLQECSKIKQWGCLKLYGGYLNHKVQKQQFPFLYSIQNIRFFNIRQLLLYNCSISTVEPLSRLNAPLLSWINMHQESATFLRPLTKLHSKQMRQLNLNGNKFQEADCLSEGDWPDLSIIYLQSNDLVSVQKFSFMAKFAQFKNQKQCYRSKQTIFIKPLQQKLKKIKVKLN